MRKDRNLVLDIIKIVATVFIVWHHYQQVFNVFYEGKINFFGGFFYFGYLVELFFCISGFLMGKYVAGIQSGKYGFSEFYAKRYLRIVPVMAISVVATTILLVVHENVMGTSYLNTIPSVWGTVSACLGIQAGWGFTNPTINNPIWYLSVLLFCYIAFYLVVRLCSRRGIALACGFIGMVFLGVGIRQYDIDLPFLNYGMGRGYYAFFWGLMLHMVLNRPEVRRYIYHLGVISVAVIAYITWLIVRRSPAVEWEVHYTMTFVYYTAVIIISQLPILNKCAEPGIMVTLASISFNVYIWHGGMFTLFIILDKVMNLNIDFTAYETMMGFTAACFVIGTLSHFLIEKPVSKRISAYLTRRSGRPVLGG